MYKISFLAMIALCASLGLVACQPAVPAAAPEVIRPVKTMTVGVASDSTSLIYSAEIRPRIESRLGFRVSGKVVERMVELGSTVRKDQPLMRLDPSDLQLAANAAQAQVASAKANDDVAQAALKRSQELAKQNFISQGALDLAAGQASSARAALDAAKANAALGVNAIQYGILRADSDGVVTSLDAEIGQVVAAGTPVIRIAAGAAKDAVFSVPEGVLSFAKRGATLSLKLWSAPDAVITGAVRDVSAMADPLTRSYVIKASLNGGAALAPLGSTGTVSLGGTRATAQVSPSLVIPLAAVVETAGKTAVWTVEGGIARKRVVTLGAQLPSSGVDTQVTVTDGLTAGAVVVVAGVHILAEGQKVKLLASAAKP